MHVDIEENPASSRTPQDEKSEAKPKEEANKSQEGVTVETSEGDLSYLIKKEMLTSQYLLS